MLVFTRRRHEAIRIGDRIEIRILRVGRDGVRIGITAPPDIPVHREEIYEEIRAANRAAVAPQGDLSVLAERLRQS
ncbi:MAG TPA: carbon storage regulator CsrA [Vicinamibacterales bacterium]|nr:carbon storage regulator CsrA [Vicinamibacterales bacterium]